MSETSHHDKSNEQSKDHTDPEVLRELFIGEGLTRVHVAERLGVTENKVKWQLQKHGIRRTNADRPWDDEETLRELYTNQQLTPPKIASKLDCSNQTIYDALEEHEIQQREGWVNKSLGSGGDGTGVNYSMDSRGHMNWNVNEDGTTKRVAVHRLLAVAEYGFEAVVDKHVHHLNHCSFDNRPDNIHPLDESVHLSHHARIRGERCDPPWVEFDGYGGFSPAGGDLPIISG